MIIFDKEYESELIGDLGRDVYEAFNPDFNTIVNTIPVDEYGFHTGIFKVTIEWIKAGGE